MQSGVFVLQVPMLLLLVLVELMGHLMGHLSQVASHRLLQFHGLWLAAVSDIASKSCLAAPAAPGADWALLLLLLLLL